MLEKGVSLGGFFAGEVAAPQAWTWGRLDEVTKLTSLGWTGDDDQ